ncbi:sodium-dependent noradrenaline transporter-like isoform X1 [Macrobrachium nipponense]|uniref:sodium-dependent noradrenaline transporter-like isoform X1 n=2 Tax=Macrobrachium nipponense TaxID=159736 RepID=UPI0030C7AD0F
METLDHQSSVSDASRASNALTVQPFATRGGRLSASSSATSKSRKSSRIELVKMPAGETMLLEVNKQKDDVISFVSMQADSITGSATIGGISVQPDTKHFDRIIKNEMAHHSREIGDDNKDKTADSETNSEAAGTGSSKDEEPILKYVIMNVLHQFYLATTSPAIFRTPALAYKWSGKDSGSGFFLIYSFVIVLVAIPMCVLEEIMAQYSSLGTITLFRCLPLLKGIGVGMVAACFILMLYSGTVFCWSILYFFDCFQKELPWTHCLHNVSQCSEVDTINRTSFENVMIPSEYYFLTKILGAFKVDEGNVLGLELSISLLFLWLGILFLLMLGDPWGTSMTSKVIALVHLSLLFAIMIIGLPLTNSGMGLNMVLHIDFDDFAEPSIWMDALGQVAWTLGPTLGLLIARASYKSFNDRIKLDVYSAVITNILVSLIVLIALTPYHGHLDSQGNVDKNPGYFFVISSFALTKLPVPQLGAAVLYLIVCKSALENTFMLASTVVISVSDLLPSKWRTGGRKFLCQCVICLLGLACGLPFVMTEGLYLLRVVDTYVPGISAISLGFAEVCGLAYIYGSTHICNHFKIMIRKSIIFFEYFWKLLVPAFLLALAVWAPVDGINWDSYWHNWTHILIPPSREEMYNTLGVVLGLIPPGLAILCTIAQIFSYRKNLKALVTPEETWGPALYQHRARYTAGIRRAKCKAPYLVVEVKDEVLEGKPYKGWIPYGFFLAPSKFTTLCTAEGFIPTDIETKVKIAHHLQEQFGCSYGLEDKVDGCEDYTGLDLLQRMISDSKKALALMNDDQKSQSGERSPALSNLSTGILLNPNSTSENLTTSVEPPRVVQGIDNLAFQR